MSNRLATEPSPYLRLHAENPVDWYPWGDEAFADAARRGVPVFVSVGYATCHWCHVMARESFSDAALADALNERFVSIKVDREEHPDVDSALLAAASAFTPQLGWPLSVFLTPDGGAFYAGTYFPPAPVAGRPSFRQVLAAVDEAWTQRRGAVDETAASVRDALEAAAAAAPFDPADLDPDPTVALLEEAEDEKFGGFGTDAKFPVVPVLSFLLARAGRDDEVGRRAGVLASRTLHRMALSPLRDPVEGGFFRYATRRDWSEPHYERMLSDNAQLLDAYARAWTLDAREQTARTAAGVADYLLRVLRLPNGLFAAGQDSESTIEGVRTEGEYFRRDAAARAGLEPPPLDRAVLTGWNGLAIGALARAGVLLDRPEWIDAARESAAALLAAHASAGGLLRMSVDGVPSSAVATLEDHGMVAEGLLRLATATGEERWARTARTLIDALVEAGDGGLAVPGGGDPVLRGLGVPTAGDPTDGALPSGPSAAASAAELLFGLTGEGRYRRAAREATVARLAAALRQPLGFGRVLELAADWAGDDDHLVVVLPDGAVDAAAIALVNRARRMPGVGLSVVTETGAARLASTGLALFEGRIAQDGRATAYRCRGLVCALPVTDAALLTAP